MNCLVRPLPEGGLLNLTFGRLVKTGRNSFVETVSWYSNMFVVLWLGESYEVEHVILINTTQDHIEMCRIKQLLKLSIPG